MENTQFLFGGKQLERLAAHTLWAGVMLCLAAAAALAEPLHPGYFETQYGDYSWKRITEAPFTKETPKAYYGNDLAAVPRDLPMPELTAKEKALGFVVFTTSWMERTFPITVPARKQIIDRIGVSAAPGEFEPATFLIRPQKDLKNVSVALAGALKGTAGAEIPADNAKLGIVNGWTKYGNYYAPVRTVIAPILKPVDIGQDYSEQFWVTLKVPGDAKPGIYRGDINILVDGSVASQLKLEVEVLAIDLLQPDAAFGMYFDQARIPSQWATADYMEKYYRDMAEHGMTSVTFYNMHGAAADGSKYVMQKEAAQKLGIDTDKPDPQKYYGFDQAVVYDFQHNLNFPPGDPRHEVGLDVMLESARKAELLRRDIPVMYLGFAVDYSFITSRWTELNIPWPGGTPDAKDCRTIAQRAKEKGWPEFLFYLMDEEGGLNPYFGGRLMLWMREVIRPIKEAGLRTADAIGYLASQEDYKKWYAKDRELDKQEFVINKQGLVVDEFLLENIYYWLDTTLFSTTIGVEDKVFDKLRALNKDYWLYNCAQPAINSEVDRFHYGLYTWRTGAKGFFQWHYTATEVTKDGKNYWPWMDENGVFHNVGDYWPMYAALSPLGPLPTISWEGVREGVDDYRYLLTLRKLIEKAEKSGNDNAKKLAVEAKAAVDNMMGKIPIDADRQIYTQLGSATPKGWYAIATEDYDIFRKTLAGWIVRLQPLVK